MPTYEYICDKCGHAFEKFQSISDKPLKVCPKELCAKKPWGHGKLKKQISVGGGLIFKGSGFYINDYRSDKYKEAAKKDSISSSTPAETKTAPKKETKPAKSDGKS